MPYFYFIFAAILHLPFSHRVYIYINFIVLSILSIGTQYHLVAQVRFPLLNHDYIFMYQPLYR